MLVIPVVLARIVGHVLPLALGATMSAPPAPAVPGPGADGWRVVTSFGRLGDFDQVTQIAATGRDDAWATAQICGHGCKSLLTPLTVLHWNGRAWRRVPVPGLGGMNPNLDIPTLAASSAANAWVFENTFRRGRARSWALRWTGRRWAAARLPDSAAIGAAATFGPADAWAFGTTGSGRRLAPFDRRWDGRRWGRIWLPAVPYAVSAFGASDMWALGITVRTLRMAPSRQVDVLMHWDGTRWRTLALPAIRRRPRALLGAWPLVVTGPRDAWIPYLIIGDNGHGNLLGSGLLHWDGTGWHRQRLPYRFFTNGAAQDGHGGLWLGQPWTFNHYGGGHWTAATPPAPRGWLGFINAMAWIPGTRSDWAAGSISKGQTSLGAIFRHTG